MDQLALGQVAGHDGKTAVLQRLEGAFFAVEAQMGFALVFIRAVAGVAVLGKDRPNLAVKVDGRSLLGRANPAHGGQQSEDRQELEEPRPAPRWGRAPDLFSCNIARSLYSAKVVSAKG